MRALPHERDVSAGHHRHHRRADAARQSSRHLFQPQLADHPDRHRQHQGATVERLYRRAPRGYFAGVIAAGSQSHDARSKRKRFLHFKQRGQVDMATPTQIVAPPPRKRSIFGPVVLIGFGIVMLMVTMGKLDARRAAYLFAQYWPLIFIFWGLVKLYEHMEAKRQGYPAPGIGAGGIVLLVFLLIFGSGASAVYRTTRNLD